LIAMQAGCGGWHIYVSLRGLGHKMEEAREQIRKFLYCCW
jgi:hypothetical protein